MYIKYFLKCKNIYTHTHIHNANTHTMPPFLQPSVPVAVIVGAPGRERYPFLMQDVGP